MNWFERGWYQEHKGTYWLLPLTCLYALVAVSRRFLYQKGWLKSYKVAVPVIVVGNMTVGGTGKTPMTLFLCKALQHAGLRVGIVSRGYGATITEPRWVRQEHTPSDVGDEPYLLASKSGCPVVVCPDRVAAAQALLREEVVDVIISDDGLQHYRLQRDIELVLIDGQRGLGNGLLLPAGPLREPSSRLKKCSAVIVNSAASTLKLAPGFEGLRYAMTLKPSAPTPLVGDAPWQGQPVHLVAAIGNPRRFEATVRAQSIDVLSTNFFPDHFAYTPKSLEALEGTVLMTEKDAVKCRSFAKANWYYLPVEAHLEPNPPSPDFMPWLLGQLQLLRS